MEPPTPRNNCLSATGVVRLWHDDLGWGAVDLDDFAGPSIWVHFSVLVMDGFRHLTPGQKVNVRWEPVDPSARSDLYGYERQANQVTLI